MTSKPYESETRPPRAEGPSRRDVMVATAGGAIAAGMLGAAGLVRPASANAALGAEMRARASAFLAALDEGQRSATTFSFDDRNWQRWNYMTGSAVSPGLPLERMSDEQKVLALDLLRSGLSEAGMDKAERVMVLQDVLRDELNKGAPDRNSERFSTAIFGTPSDTGTWAWRFEGHHLTLTYTLVGDEIVSVTPSSFSSDPNTVASGPHRGLVALVDEEEMGRTLFRDLSAQNRDWPCCQTSPTAMCWRSPAARTASRTRPRACRSPI